MAREDGRADLEPIGRRGPRDCYSFKEAHGCSRGCGTVAEFPWRRWSWAWSPGSPPEHRRWPRSPFTRATALRDAWSGGPVRWNPYDPPATGYAGMGDSVLHAWCWEQGVAFHYGRHHA